MSAPQSLLQAAVNRLSARLASGLADTAASVTLIAQDAPERLRQELQLFWQEVEQEAARLEREGPGTGPGAGGSSTGWNAAAGPPGAASAPGAGGRGQGGPGAASSSGRPSDPQDMIDALRAQVAGLAQRLDTPAAGPGSAASPQPTTPAPGRGA